MNHQIEPLDKYNLELLENVHPASYQPPEPKPLYDLVVIGAGTAGLVTAAASSGLGAKVALIEKNFMGGDCLNYGCVPSKALISAARRKHAINLANPFGIEVDTSNVHIDFSKIMERMRQKRSQISSHDSVKRFTELGVDVFLGQGKFVDKSTIIVNNKKLKFRKAVITTGARPLIPPINGIEETGYLTNETVFNLTKLPKQLIIIGGGPIGCELAQTFTRLGSHVSLIHNNKQLLNKEDRDASSIVQNQFINEGIKIFLDSRVISAKKHDNNKVITLIINNKEQILTADEILVAAGRIPNIEGLDLSSVNVKTSRYGIVVNDKLQTSNPNIYSAGDVCSKYKFTHAADFMARIVIQNALFKRGAKFSSLVIPRCTYTYPEIAHVGASENTIDNFNKFMIDFKDVDRAIVADQEKGFVKVLLKKGTDKIIGATIVAENAGDMIGEFTMAIVNKIGLSSIAGIIHPYPTIAEAIRKLGDSYNRTKLTPVTQKILKILMWFGLRR